MTTSPDDARHLTFTTLDELWSNGAPMVLPIKGEPACRLQLDPKNGLITLVTAVRHPRARRRQAQERRLHRGLGGRRRTCRTHRPGRGQRSRGVRAPCDHRRRAPDREDAARRRGRRRGRPPSERVREPWRDDHREGGRTARRVALPGVPHPSDRSGPGRVLMAGTAVGGTRLHIRLRPHRGEDDQQRASPARHPRTRPVGAAARRSAEPAVDPAHPDVLRTAGEPFRRSSPTSERSRAVTRSPSTPCSPASAGRTTTPTCTRPSGRSVPSRAPTTSRATFPAMTPDLVGPVVPNFALLSEVSYRVDLTDLHYDALPDPIGGFVESKES